MKNLWLASLMLTDGDGIGEEGGRVTGNGTRTSVSTAAVSLARRVRLVTSFSQGLFLHKMGVQKSLTLEICSL